MDSADVALAVHWTFLVGVFAAIVVGNVLWIRWLVRKFSGSPQKALVEKTSSIEPFWSPADFLVFFGAFLTAFFLLSGALAQPATDKEANRDQKSKATEQTVASNDLASAMPATSPPKTSTDPADPEVDASPATSVGPMPSDSVVDDTATGDEPESEADLAKKAAGYRLSILAHMAANFTAVILTVAWLVLSYARPPRDFGFNLGWSDVRSALIAAVWVLGPVLLMSALLSNWVEYEHVLLDTMAADPSWSSITVLFVSAVVVTPVAEEIGFRMLLQGGIENFLRSSAMEKMAGPIAPNLITWVPILLASAFFSLMHLGQGAAPIALFFFSLGLGYLYHRTGRIWIPIIIHAVLNAATLIVEYSYILSQL